MKVYKFLAVLAFIFSSCTALAQANRPIQRRPKAVRVIFDGKPSSRRLSRVELAERAAYIRHLKRLKAMYNQPVPELQ